MDTLTCAGQGTFFTENKFLADNYCKRTKLEVEQGWRESCIVHVTLLGNWPHRPVWISTEHPRHRPWRSTYLKQEKKWHWRALPVSKWEIWNTTHPSRVFITKIQAGRSLYKIKYNGNGSSRKEKQTRSCGKNLRHLHNFQHFKRFATANSNLMSASDRYVRYKGCCRNVITLTAFIILNCISVTVLRGHTASAAQWLSFWPSQGTQRSSDGWT